jgi:hypothetical protein
MFLPFVLLLWLVLVMLVLAAFVDAVEECQAKGQRAKRSATFQSSVSPPVRPSRFHLLHHSH